MSTELQIGSPSREQEYWENRSFQNGSQGFTLGFQIRDSLPALHGEVASCHFPLILPLEDIKSLLLSDTSGKVSLNYPPPLGFGNCIGYIAHYIWLSLLLNKIGSHLNVSGLELLLFLCKSKFWDDEMERTVLSS